MADRIRWWILLGLIAGGCTVGPDYQVPETTTPPGWNEIAPAGTATRPARPTTQPSVPTSRPADLACWWKSLNDPMLDSLIARAVESNLDLRLATARVREARAQRGVIAASWWPQVDASAAYAYRGGSLNTGPKTEGGSSLGDQVRTTVLNSAIRSLTSGGGATSESLLGQIARDVINSRQNGDRASTSRGQNLFQLGLDAAWELDVFGGTRRAVEAADADIAAAEEGRRDVLVTLLAEVALNYVQLRGAQRRLAIVRENIQAQQDTVDLTVQQYRAGFINELPVAQAGAQLASTRSQVPLLDNAIKQAVHQLEVLLAQLPGTLGPELERPEAIPSAPPEVPIGVPSELLRRRPDIRTAERQLAAATARIGEATADLFPRFSLTGSFGSQTRDVRHLLDRNSLTWSVGPAVSWPVFDGWRIRSNIEVQNARQEQALTVYETVVLSAFREVEDALVAYLNEQIRRDSLVEAVDASRRAVELSNDLYARGLADFLNVLTSQRALYASQDELVQSEATAITNLIALYKALGGGWSASD